MVLMFLKLTSELSVMSDEFGWDEDGVDILGSVPVHTTGSFVHFPLHKGTLRYLRKTTSTAVFVLFPFFTSKKAYVTCL